MCTSCLQRPGRGRWRDSRPGLVMATSRNADDSGRRRALSRIVPRPIALDRLQSFFVEFLKGRGLGDLLQIATSVGGGFSAA